MAMIEINKRFQRKLDFLIRCLWGKHDLKKVGSFYTDKYYVEVFKCEVCPYEERQTQNANIKSHAPNNPICGA